MTPTPSWEERFREEFVATGADIEGIKRVEYRQIREHQIDSIISFIRQEVQEAYERGLADNQKKGEAYRKGYQAGQAEERGGIKSVIENIKRAASEARMVNPEWLLEKLSQ